MGQHKHNPTAIAAAKGELPPKERERRLTKRQEISSIARRATSDLTREWITARTAGHAWTAGWRTQTMESEKLVSADGLREWLKKIPLHDLSDGRGLCRIIFAEDFERAMASFPGDTIQIVRCKGCKYYRNHPNGLCYLHTEPKENERGYSGVAVCVEPDDFCSYGVKKGGTVF